jgi:hypothetical protein
MLASSSWTTFKRRTYSSSSPQAEEFYSLHSDDKSFFRSSQPPTSTLLCLGRHLYVKYFLFVLLGLFLGRTVFTPTYYDLPSLTYRNAKARASTLRASVGNATLGTAGIIVLNSASRPDRRDYLSLMAAMTGLQFTYMNAWTTKPVENALPTEHNPWLKDVEYACWRTHADAWRKVVEEGWTTAMILEDDADWDGGIHESMALAWKALINITGDPLAATEAKS